MTASVKKKVEQKLQQAYRFLEAGEGDKARGLADELAAETLDDPRLDNRLAELYYGLGYFVSAVALHYKALQGKPDDPAFMAGLAKALIANKQYPEADILLSKALAFDERCMEAIVSRTHLLMATQNYSLAIEWLEKAVQLHSTDGSVYTNLPLALGILGRHEEATDYAAKALRRFPKNPNILYAVARTYAAAGQTKEAERALLKAIQLQPSYGAAYLQLTVGKRFTSEDLPIIQQAEMQLRQGMPAAHRSNFLFALGKMYDDLRDYDKAFSYYQQANRLIRSPEKPDNDVHLVRFQQKLLSQRNRLKSGSQGHESRVPIFVVGMPRSGTSLIEQIIASHPQAAGAGELTKIPEITDTLFHQAKKKTLLPVDAFVMPDQSIWQQSGEEYLAVLRAGREEALRITDKMPENYRFLGLITMMFPAARILHITRHPLDIALSCYFQTFVGLAWSNDLQWIAETYRQYRKTIEMWKKTLPAGKIIDIQYEDLIADQEAESKKIINACGLEWNQACLDFSKNSRAVRTASVWQVRQEIYQRSKMRWVPYAKHLTGLASEISEFLTEDDFKIFEEQGLQVKRPSLVRKLSRSVF